MNNKSGKSYIWQVVKRSIWIGVAAEVAFLAGSYAVWRRMNTDSEFRKYMNENFPYALEGYYKVGEILGKGAEIRHLDVSNWKTSQSTKKD